MSKGSVAGIRRGKTGNAAGFEVVNDMGREKERWGRQVNFFWYIEMLLVSGS